MALRKNHRIVGVLCACMLGLAAAGCATTSYNSTGEWQQPRSRDVPFQNVLVVTIVPDSDARRAFEKTVADAITDGSAWGVAAYSISGETASKLTKDMVVAMAEESGADSVLVTKVLDRAAQLARDREEAIVHVGPITKVVQSEDSSFTRSLTTNYAIEVVPGSLVIEAEAVLESSLYEVATGYKLVYRATTRGHFELSGYDRIEQVADRFALAVIKRLRSDQVIR
jgi:outer membrane lipoprotein SlyB